MNKTPFTYDGNANESYDIFYNGRKIAEVFLGEDRVLEMVEALNEKIILYPHFYCFWN